MHLDAGYLSRECGGEYQLHYNITRENNRTPELLECRAL